MGHRKTTSARVAKIASKALRSNSTSRTTKKLAGALKVLDAITPLIRKLSAQDTALIQDPRIPALQQELERLKTLIVSLGTTNSSTDTTQKIEQLQKTSFSIFGKKKKSQTCQRPLDLDYNKAILYKE